MARLPETILLRAEVKWRLGDNAGAAADINKLRERAQCGYMVMASDVNLDLILDERARELVYEEHRWNTLLRMGGTVAIDRIKSMLIGMWLVLHLLIKISTFGRFLKV